jgi:hypothetical protein
MKLAKTQRRSLLIPVFLSLAALVLASMPAAAQLDPKTPTPQPRLSSQAAEFSVYLPLIVSPPVADLVIAGAEIIQATQILENSVSLVANKPTVMRVYAQNTVGPAINGVYVSLSATRNGLPLAGSPMTQGPLSVSNTWTRGSLSSSFNFTLPSAWLSGLVTLQIRVDPNNAINEGYAEGNNLTSLAANFNVVPALNVKVVPLTYIHPPSGQTYPPAGSSYLGPGLVRMYPVSSAPVTVRSSITWSRNLSVDSNWSLLLNQVTTLKETDGAPDSQVYYGLVPLFDNNGFSWFNGGVVGIGWINYRVSVGMADASPYLSGVDTANHEIGHNLGRDHAPCGVSGDNNYPYAGGLIGQYGLRVDTMKLYDPATYVDIMSYCEPVWISDYNYQALFDNQMVNGAAAQTNQQVEGLLVRASLLEDGTVALDPSYAFSGAPDRLPAESDYMLELLDANGGLVAAYPLPVLRAEEEQISIRSIISLVPLPDKPYASLRIVEKGQPKAERALASARPERLLRPAIEASQQGAVLRWGVPNTPAVVRYTTDNGATWTTLALDYLGGELTLDAQALPQGNLHFEIILADQTGSSLTLDWDNSQ